MSTRIAFLKGHGTENDFVIVPDPDNTLDLSPRTVAALCDRRAGIGGDGVLHVVRSAAHPEARHLADEAEWFMDYRNADGSVAEMCGNGVRVFARYLQRAGHAGEGDLPIATRGGVKHAHLAKDEPGAEPGTGPVTVAMGRAVLPGGDITVATAHGTAPALNVSMGNPHAVAFVADLADAGDLLSAPAVTPAGAYPDGVNVEYVVDRGPGGPTRSGAQSGGAGAAGTGTPPARRGVA
ncbi:diaminopimelate epimerase, partial [Streptomyces albidoflavus]|uniref:diaminopimelate epimerase n=1 Tax=Streptomyces albidoflavus TaxID=1886 RepID=UPI0033A969A4